MKRVLALITATLIWGCASDPSLDEAPKAGVEERTTVPGQAGQGPATAPVAPGGSLTVKPVTPEVSATEGVDPILKDPNSILSKRSIFYDFDSDVIKEEYRTLVQAHAQYLASHPQAKMLIQGNCDERGSREYNIALGQRRADALKRMLVLLGARESQIEAVSLGEEKPRCTTDSSEACLSQNRRSDMLYGGEF